MLKKRLSRTGNWEEMGIGDESGVRRSKSKYDKNTLYAYKKFSKILY